MSLVEMMKKVKPYAFMVFMQFGFAGSYVIAVSTLKQGMSHYVLVVYRNSAAVVALAPFAFWFERKGRPKVTLVIFLKIVGLAILEPVLDQNIYYVGAKLTSASFAASLYNMLPAFTFVIAILLRMEKVKLKSRHSQAKIVGTLVTVAGAVVMILYKGPILEFLWSKGRSHQAAATGVGEDSHWLTGTFLLIASCICWSIFFILQANTLKDYPAELSLSTWICFIGMMLSTAVTLVMEKGSQPWKIGWDTRLFTAIYSGVMCSGVTYYIQGIVMKERGPVFVTAFNPLCMIITAALGSILLAEEIPLGRVIGAIIIVFGLYALIWGKSKDHLTQSLEADEKDRNLKLPIAVKNTEQFNIYGGCGYSNNEKVLGISLVQDEEYVIKGNERQLGDKSSQIQA